MAKKKLIRSPIDDLFIEAGILIAGLGGIDGAARIRSLYVVGDRMATQGKLQEIFFRRLTEEERRTGNVALLVFTRFIEEIKSLKAGGKPQSYQSAGQFPEDWNAGKNAHVL